MMNRVAILIVLTVGVFGALHAPGVRADEWDKKTIVTFNEPIQVPGTVLPAGTYIFKLADSEGDRNIVQIFNSDETQLLASVLAIPDYRETPSDKAIVTFEERPSGEPEALQSWFYPGDNYGQQFVYPKQKATQLAQANSQPVPSVPDEVTERAALKTASVTRVTSAPTTPKVADVSSDDPSVTIVEEDELPQTASPLASIALFGLMFLGGAAALRRFATASR